MTDLRAVLAAALWAAEAASLAYVAYRSLLGLLSLRPIKPVQPGPGKTRFLIIVPAHNEEAVIVDTVDCLRALEYPRELVQLYVIADNCSDATVERARVAGAAVLVKSTPSYGKGSVIQWALASPEVTRADWDALIIIDADSRPALDFLRIMEGALADGDRVLQARSESHGQKGWVPTAYAMNTAQRNRTWHLAREASGFSAALTGTGICITRELLAAYPPRTHTLTEDLEYGALLTREGVRVRYLYQASVVIDQPPSLKASVGQRLRWARGQLLTAFAFAPGLLWRSLRRLDISALDTALYLFLPSIVPMQAFLLVTEVGHLAIPRFWPTGSYAGLPDIHVAIYGVVLLLSFVLPSFGLHAEHKQYHLRDWVAFALLMATWIPIALVAAGTTWVGSWNRTARSDKSKSGPLLPTRAEAAARRAEAAAAPTKPRIAPDERR